MLKLISAYETSGFRRQVYGEIRALKDRGLLINGDYWASRVEMFARAFEAHVQLKLERQGRQNTYLSQPTGSLLWPTREQAEAMEPMFDALIAQIKKEDFPGSTRRDSRAARIQRFAALMSR